MRTLRRILESSKMLAALNGLAFALVWERLGTGYAWAYNMTPDIAGVPIPILAAWSIFSVLTVAEWRSHLLIPLAFTLADILASRVGLWSFNLSTIATVALTALGYYMIHLMLRAVNRVACWTPACRVAAPLLAAASAYIAYTTLAIAYYRSLSISLVVEIASRLLPHKA